jgi:hypothetical protein
MGGQLKTTIVASIVSDISLLKDFREQLELQISNRPAVSKHEPLLLMLQSFVVF